MRSLRVLALRLQVPVASLLTHPDGGAPLEEGNVAELQRLCRTQQFEQVLVRTHQILEWARTPELLANVHHFVGHALANLARPEEALDHLLQARGLFESLDDDHGRVAETMELEALALQVAEDPRAFTVAEDALRRYRAVDGRRPEIESRLLLRLGTILLSRMEFGAALTRYEEALHVAGGVRDLGQLARLYHGMANCHISLGELRAGSELLLKAHTLYEAEERLAGAGGKSDLARAENDLGVLLLRSGDLSRAEEYLTSSLRRFEHAELERLRSHLYLSIGELRLRQGRFDESAVFIEKAIDFARRFNETRALAAGHRERGELHAICGQMDLAAAAFQRALTILADAGLERQHAQCLAARDRALSGRRDAEATGTSA